MFISATMLVNEELLFMLDESIATFSVEFVFESSLELRWILAHNYSNFRFVTLSGLGHVEEKRSSQIMNAL